MTWTFVHAVGTAAEMDTSASGMNVDGWRSAKKNSKNNRNDSDDDPLFWGQIYFEALILDVRPCLRRHQSTIATREDLNPSLH